MDVQSGENISLLLLHDNIHLTKHQIHGQHIIPFSFILVRKIKS